MKKLFENAYFGKPYKTRDGRKALYFCQPFKNVAHRLFIEGTLTYTAYNDYGRVWIEECGDDIVSEWQEPINEEELDELANEYFYSLERDNGIRSNFKAGYRKAWENKQ